jgi:heat shock 70kDa protein 4
VVGFDLSRMVGEHATSGMMSNYKNTVTGSILKRLIGLSYDDPRATYEMEQYKSYVTCVPYPHKSGGPSSIGIQVQLSGETKTLPIEAIYGMMVQHMGEIAALKASQTATEPNIPLLKLLPQDWVIAIPNYYTDAQRRSVLAACEMVGLKGVNRLMHETTATALAFGIFKDLKKEFAEQKGMVMFIDMGATSYTVCIAAFEPGKLIIKSVHSDINLGGRDFDKAIAQWIAEQFANKYKGKLSSHPMEAPKTRLKLLAAAETAKKTLSPAGVKEARINLEMLQDDYDFVSSLETSVYEKLCAPLLARLSAPVEAALAEAGITVKDLTAVEIVGGSTRIGFVKRRLMEILGSGVTLSTTMNADESVARGAALQSAILSPRFKVLPYEIVEAQPYPIQVSWQDGNHAAGVEVDATSGTETATDSVIMFDRGLAFPIVRRVTLRRAGEFTVQALYDDTAQKYGLPIGASTTSIAEFRIKAPKGEEKKIRVNVKEDINGIIHLSSSQMVEDVEGGDDEAAAAPTTEGGETAEAKKKIKKTNLEFTTIRPLDWSADEIVKANEIEVAMANADRIVRETSDMRNELESYIYDMRDKISSDSMLGLYGTDAEKAAFVAKNEAMENWLYEDGFDAKKSAFAEKLAELKALGGPIEKRQTEALGRAAAVSKLQATLELFNNWANESQVNDIYAHITDEERTKVRNWCDTTSGWMYEKLDQQGGLTPQQDAVLTIADLESKNQFLNVNCGPIMRKPVPKKAAEPPPAKTEESTPSSTTEPSGQETNKDNESMDVDPTTAPGGKSTEPMQTD